MSFWNKLKKPVFVLAPMADVTDASFRRVIAKYGKPDTIRPKNFFPPNAITRLHAENHSWLEKKTFGQRPLPAQGNFAPLRLSFSEGVLAGGFRTFAVCSKA